MAGMIPTSSAGLADSIYGFPSPPLSMSGNEDIPFNNFIPAQMPIPMTPAATHRPTPPPVQQAASVRKDEYISYYFKYVRALQFVFAGDTFTNILLSVSSVPFRSASR